MFDKETFADLMNLLNEYTIKEREIIYLKESKDMAKESKDMALKMLANVESEVLRSKQLFTSRGILEFILQKSFYELKQKNKEVDKFFKATNHAKYLDKNINENYTGKTFFIIYFCTFF